MDGAIECTMEGQQPQIERQATTSITQTTPTTPITQTATTIIVTIPHQTTICPKQGTLLDTTSRTPTKQRKNRISLAVSPTYSSRHKSYDENTRF